MLPCTVWVMPKVFPLTGDSYVWHYTLESRGYNDLPRWRRAGKVTGLFQLNTTYRTFSVYFPGVGVEIKSIFPDELKLYQPLGGK